MMDLAILIFVFLSTVANVVNAAECQPEIVGSVLGTFAATLVLLAIAYFIIRRWKRKKDGASENARLDSSNADDHKYAYDNPYYYNDDETGGPHVNVDTAEKGESVQERGQSNGTPEQKKGNGNQKAKKNKTTKTNLLTALTNSKIRPRALDDSCLKLEPEKILVPLRGIDFTGLGFNICGNMRDGIFVRDVLHRGPAMESGKIKAGDRILSVNVSFANVVYEDALTILSYASPYDVHLEVQKMSDSSGRNPHLPGHQKKASNGSTASGSGLGSGPSSGVPGSTGVSHPGANIHERLYHPLYRSQSIGDLSQIGKDSAGAKRSLSVGGPPKLKKSPSSSASSGDVSPSTTPKVTPPLVTKTSIEAEADDVPKSSRFKVEKVSEVPVKSAAPEHVPVTDKVRVLPDRFPDDVDVSTRKGSCSSSEDGKQFDLSVSSAADESLELREPAISFSPDEVLGSLDEDHRQETAVPPIVKPPRKGSTPGKRKAPPPPARSLSNDNDDNSESALDNLILVSAEPFAVSTSTLQVSPDIHEVPKWVREGEDETAKDTVDTSVDSVAIQTAFSDTDSSEDEPDSRSGPGMAGTFPLRNKRASASRWQETSTANNPNSSASTKAAKVPRRATSLDNLCVMDSSSRGTRDFVGAAGLKKAQQPPPLERAVSMDFRHVGTLPVGQLSLQRERIDQDRGRLGSGGASTSEELVPLKKPRFGACENLHLEGDSDDDDDDRPGGESSGSWASDLREEETGEREVTPTSAAPSALDGDGVREGEGTKKFRVTMYVDGNHGKCVNNGSDSDGGDSGSEAEFNDSLERKQDALAEPDVVLVSLTPVPPNGDGESGERLDEGAPKTVDSDRGVSEGESSSTDVSSSLSDDSLQAEEKKIKVKTKRRRRKEPPLKSYGLKESGNGGGALKDSSEEEEEDYGEEEHERSVHQTVLPDVISSENGRDHHQLHPEAAAYPMTTVHQDGEIGTSLVTIDIPVIPAAFNMKDRRSPIMHLNSASSSGPSSGSSAGWDRDKPSDLFNNVSVSNRTLNPVAMDGSYTSSVSPVGKNGEDTATSASVNLSPRGNHDEAHRGFSSSDEDSCNGHGREGITPTGDTIRTVSLVDTTTIAGKTVGPEYKYAVSEGNVMVIIPHSQFNPEQGNELESPPPRLEAPE